MSSSSPSPDLSEAAHSGKSGTFFRNSNNLYLITFLATLSLLLFVSIVVFLRSYIIRRRFPMHLDEAIAAGIVLSPRAQSRVRRFATKPKLFTSWLVPGGGRWDQIMPLAALSVQAKRRSRPKPIVTPVPSVPIEPPNTNRRSLIEKFILRHNISDIKSPPPTQPPIAKTVAQRIDLLQISVIIAMPTHGHDGITEKTFRWHGSNEDQEIPNVVFGVARLPFKFSLLQ